MSAIEALPASRIDDAVRAVRPQRVEDPRRAFAAGAWTCIAEPGDGAAGTLVQSLGADGALQAVLAGLPPTSRAVADAVARWAPRLDLAAVEAAFRHAARLGIRLLLPDDEDWPAGLADLGPHAPIALWALSPFGRLPAFGRSVALVGARAATPYGERVTADAAAGLVDRGFAVVSGGALGIDGIAHRSTLRSGGLTIAVMAGGLDRLYPASNADLLHQVAREGVLVAELPCGARPAKWRFKHRNRLIAAMSRATVVVEAAARSGAANTAAHAAELGRPLGAVPGSVYSPSSVGCHTLIRELGAVPMRDAADMAALAADPGSAVTLDGLDPAPSAADPTEARVLDLLTGRAAPLRALAAAAGFSEADTRDALAFLALEGRAEETPSGWRRR